MGRFHRIFFISYLLIGMLLAAGCATSSPAPDRAPEQPDMPVPTVISVTANSTTAFPEPARCLKENTSLFIDVGPIPNHFPGDTITFTGTTNLPAGEIITTWIYEARFKCTKCVPANNSVEGCCGDRIPLSITVRQGKNGINTWSREVNTSAYDFSTGEYQIDAGATSCGIWNSSSFTLLKRPEPSGSWIMIDPIPHSYLGDTISFHGTTNLPPGEMIRTRVFSAEFARCPRSIPNCLGNVMPCCGGYSDIVSVIEGPSGINAWSWEIRTLQHGFEPDHQYIIYAIGRNGAVENFSLFTVHGIPKSNLTLNLPANDSGGSAIRFSGQANTGNGPDEKLLLSVSSDSGKKAGYSVPVYRDGTGYYWNFTLNKSAITPYNFLTVNVSSQTSPDIRIERTFLYNNEPAYYPYDPVGP